MTFPQAIVLAVTIWIALVCITVCLCVRMSRPYDRGFADGIEHERHRQTHQDERQCPWQGR